MLSPKPHFPPQLLEGPAVLQDVAGILISLSTGAEGRSYYFHFPLLMFVESAVVSSWVEDGHLVLSGEATVIVWCWAGSKKSLDDDCCIPSLYWFRKQGIKRKVLSSEHLQLTSNP